MFLRVLVRLILVSPMSASWIQASFTRLGFLDTDHVTAENDDGGTHVDRADQSLDADGTGRSTCRPRDLACDA